jgi:hypothetical protein
MTKQKTFTEQELKKLWRVLRGVTETPHEWEPVPNGITKDQHRCKRCYRYTPTEGLEVKSPCPEVPLWPDPLPVLAEEIRKWMEKADVKIQCEYSQALAELSKDRNDGAMYLCWLIFDCTPTDRIQAFLNLGE